MIPTERTFGNSFKETSSVRRERERKYGDKKKSVLTCDELVRASWKEAMKREKNDESLELLKRAGDGPYLTKQIKKRQRPRGRRYPRGSNSGRVSLPFIAHCSPILPLEFLEQNRSVLQFLFNLLNPM